MDDAAGAFEKMPKFLRLILTPLEILIKGLKFVADNFDTIKKTAGGALDALSKATGFGDFFARVQCSFSAVGKLGAREYRLNTVIIARRNWIEFVVMTTGATQRISQKRDPHTVGHIIEP